MKNPGIVRRKNLMSLTQKVGIVHCHNLRIFEEIEMGRFILHFLRRVINRMSTK